MPNQSADAHVGLLVLLAVTFMTTAGCVSTPQVKAASAQTSSALQALRESEDTFRRAYLKEIDETIAQVKRAIVAKAVRREVERLAKEEQQGDLIAVSRGVEVMQASVRALLEDLSKRKVSKDLDARQELAAFRSERARDLQEAAKLLEEQAKTSSTSAGARTRLLSSAAELRARAGVLGDEEYVSSANLADILNLLALKASVDGNLKDLGDQLAVLQAIHATIHEWVMTDVTVSGKEVAGLVQKHAGTLGLSSGGAAK